MEEKEKTKRVMLIESILEKTNKYTNKISLKDAFAKSVNPVFGKLGSLYELRSEKFIDEGSYGHFEMVIREYNPAYPDNSQYEPILLILPHDIHGGHPDAMNISESLAENHSIEDCYNV